MLGSSENVTKDENASGLAGGNDNVKSEIAELCRENDKMKSELAQVHENGKCVVKLSKCAGR